MAQIAPSALVWVGAEGVGQLGGRVAREVERDSQPLVGAGPCGAFTMYQLLAIDFAYNLESHLSEAQLAHAAPSVDAAAGQVFAKLLDGRSAAVQGATSSALRS